VVVLGPDEAARFAAGEDVEPDWDGDWGYLIAAHEVAGGVEPVGVGLYLRGELRSMVPKGTREDLPPV
jgi:NOL1/NOP2/fmu family ribosome biogenesis protein